jgi:hypothetical protein
MKRMVGALLEECLDGPPNRGTLAQECKTEEEVAFCR